jgi:hypothetical protein
MLTYIIEHCGKKKLAKIFNIPLFKIGYDPMEHIHYCKNEWCRIRYKDKRVWLHVFLNTLDEIYTNGTKYKQCLVTHSTVLTSEKNLSKILNLPWKKNI